MPSVLSLSVSGSAVWPMSVPDTAQQGITAHISIGCVSTGQVRLVPGSAHRVCRTVGRVVPIRYASSQLEGAEAVVAPYARSVPGIA
eukprot:2330079-Rhodomonas_salina.2